MLNPESWKLSREDIINTFGIGRKKKYISLSCYHLIAG